MRLWTLHPRYLDSRGLVALWREGLLAQAVLRGQTQGYRHHPQLERFRDRRSPVGAIVNYLRIVHEESVTRGYKFAKEKLSRAAGTGLIAVTRGQLDYEWDHLLKKLAVRDPEWRAQIQNINRPAPHPLFRIVPGGTESWEKLSK